MSYKDWLNALWNDVESSEFEDEAGQRGIAPGKRTLTMSLPARTGPRAVPSPAPVQQMADPRAQEQRAKQHRLTQQWMDTAMRPDLYGAPVQRKAGPGGERAAVSGAGSGQPMPEQVQATMGDAFGVDFSAVRIHEGPQARALGALAYTQGTDIHFAPGQYQPHSQRGKEILGHELTHVVQQAQGRVRATTQAKGAHINNDSVLEQEADEMGARAARGQSVAVGPVPSSSTSTAESDRPRLASLSATTVQRLLDGEAAVQVRAYFGQLAANLTIDPDSAQNQEILNRAIADHDTVEAACQYLDNALGQDQAGDPPLDDTAMKNLFGFYVNDADLGHIDDSVALPVVTNQVDTIQPDTSNVFVGSITTIPESKGGVSPASVAERYQTESVAGDAAQDVVYLVFGVNYRADLDGNVEVDIQTDIESVQNWTAFGVTSGGFVWHQWYDATGQPASIEDVRGAYGGQDSARQEQIRAHQASKDRKIPYGAARSRTFELTKPVAANLATRAKNVWIHVSDPDTQSMLSRTGRRSGEEGASEEAQVPLFEQYLTIIRELMAQYGEDLPPTVISGGYEFRASDRGGDVEKNEVLAMLGHRLDVEIRSAIANADPARNTAKNTYLPEPNLLFKWERFLLNTRDLFGTDVRESVKMLKNYIASSGQVPIIRYDIRANSATKTDERFRIDSKRAEGSQPLDLDNFDPQRLTKDDLWLITHQSQSYANYETWVIPIAENFQLKGQVLLQTFKDCMITEVFEHDPQEIRDNLDGFAVPLAADIFERLRQHYTRVQKNKTVGYDQEKRQPIKRDVVTYKAPASQERLEEIAAQLHQAGAAMVRFMRRVLIDGVIPDPFFEHSLQALMNQQE
ncbi:MAG: DUF4157 domain-containing protein [Proteobacteria bacterium]|nr:DUF4157 domain-containing protein [Pseudomonadota bacterium]